MNNIKKSPLKIYLLTVSFVMGIIILIIYFKVTPELIKVMAEISSTQADTMKNRSRNVMLGSLIFIFLANFGFWKLDDKLRREEEKIRNILKMNPNDPLLQEKLKQIEKKRKSYIAIIEPIFIIVLGAIIGFWAISIISPLYRIGLGIP